MQLPTPYKLSPTSGTIQENKIVGRQKEINQLTGILQTQSIVLKQFRRMGKTLLLKKFVYQSSHTQKAVYFMLQGVSNVTELTDALLHELRNDQRFGKAIMVWDNVKKLYNKLRPELEIQDISFKLPEFTTQWKEALSACIKDIANRKKEEDEILTLVLDEFPIMLWEWIQNGRAQDAIDLLNVLRKLRQTHEADGKIRFIICGSIGMEVVIDRLKKEFSYVGEAFNDMYKYSMEAMNYDDAIFLCECLYIDDFTSMKDEPEYRRRLFELVSKNVDNIPVYIHAQFSIIKFHHASVLSEDTIDLAYQRILTRKGEDYSEMLDQLWERLAIYYDPAKAKLMRQLLSYLSKRETTVTEDEIIRSVQGEPEELEASLSILERDHYLICTGHPARAYQFKYQFIKKWWSYNKA
jgi:hypothetical protein